MKHDLNTELIYKMLIYCYNNQPLYITFSNEVTNLYTDKNEFTIKNGRLCDKNNNPVKYKKNELQYDYDTQTIKCVNTDIHLIINESGYIDISQEEIISDSGKFKYEIYRMFLASHNAYSIGISRKKEISHHEAISFEFKVINGYLTNRMGDKVIYKEKFLKFNSDNNTINICNKDEYINIDPEGNININAEIKESAIFYSSPHLNQLAKSLFLKAFPNHDVLHNNELSSTIVDYKSYIISKKINQWIVNQVVYDLHGSHPHGVSRYIRECLEIHQIQANKTNCIVSCAFNVGAGIHAQYDGLPALRTGVVNSIPEKYKKELEHTKFLIIVIIRPDGSEGKIVYNHDMNTKLPSEYKSYIEKNLEIYQKTSEDKNIIITCNFNNFNESFDNYIPEKFINRYRKDNTITVILEPDSSLIY